MMQSSNLEEESASPVEYSMEDGFAIVPDDKPGIPCLRVVAVDPHAAKADAKAEQVNPVEPEGSGQEAVEAKSDESASSTELSAPSFILDETADVKRRIRELPESRVTMILAGLAFMLFGCWYAFGWLACSSVIFALCGLIFLTQHTRLSKKCQVAAADNSLQITLFDAVGKSALAIPKEKIGAIRETKDSFELDLREQFVSLPQQIIFHSVLKTRLRPDNHASTGGTLPARSSDCSATMDTIMLPLAGLAAGTDRDRMKAMLQALLPEGQQIEQQENKEEEQPVEGDSREISTVTSTEARVAYNPNKVAKDNAAKWMRKNNWKVSTLLFIVGLGVTLGLGISKAFLVLMGVGLLCFLAAMHERERPGHISFTADGIAFIWHRKNGESRSTTIPWENVSHVSAFCSTGRKLFDTMIDFRLIPEKMPLAQRLLFAWMMPEYFDRSPLKLRLRAGGIENLEARHSLLEAVRRYMPPDKVEDEVFKVLNPTDPESYTTLWLDSLGNSPRRFAEGQLPSGYTLDNGRFEIVEVLGAGGQATAYLAKELVRGESSLTPVSATSSDEQPSSEQPPAVPSEKLIVLKEFILPSHAGAELSTRSLEHIQREHELIKRIHNSQVVEYHGLFVEDHRAYLILEYVDGPSLRQYVEQNGKLSREKALDLAAQMADILCHLHSQSPPVVHRDFTPENLMLCKDGTLKLIDFNVAQELETSATRTIVGKHSYIPPEQFRGKPVPQSDIYAMGAGLYFLLTGEEPEPISVSHPILKRPEVGGELDELVAKATRSELSKRFANAQELLAAVQKLREGSSSLNLVATDKEEEQAANSSVDSPSAREEQEDNHEV
jgi:serine/threonine protein kinase